MVLPPSCESCGALVSIDADGGYGCANCGHTKRPSEPPATPVVAPPMRAIERADVTFFVFVWGRIKAAVDKAIDEWLTR